jgi:hypothetical protein
MGERWYEDDALSVREGAAGESADSAAEKILVLVELHDVIARTGVRQQSIPWLRLSLGFHLTFIVIMHANFLRSKCNFLNFSVMNTAHPENKTYRKTRRNCGEPFAYLTLPRS